MFNIYKYLDSRGLDYKESDEEFILRECPVCGKRKWKFYIKSSHPYLSHCFNCKIGLNLAQLVSEIECWPIRKSIEYVYGKDVRESKLSKLKRKSMKDVILDRSEENTILNFYPEIIKLDHVHPYLKSRGITKDIINFYDLHIAYDGRHKDRIIIPVYQDGILKGWQGRDFTGKQSKGRKILSPKGFKKSRYMLGYDSCKQKKAKYAVLCEGPFDAMMAYKHNSLAIFGKELSTAQFNLLLILSGHVKTLYIGLDPEEVETINEVSKDLSLFFDIFVLPIPKGKDLGDSTQKEIDGYIKNAVPYKNKLEKFKKRKLNE